MTSRWRLVIMAGYSAMILGVTARQGEHQDAVKKYM